MTGTLITLEGLDGAGKTTAIKQVIKDLKEKYTNHGHPELADRLVYTREPGGDKISEQIRNVILDKDNTQMDPMTEVMLYAASRRQHLKDVIEPLLKDDKIVFCDRFVDSSIAYQGYGRQIGYEKVKAANDLVTDGITPDVTLYFKICPEIGLKRINQHRTDQINRLDQEQLDFYDRVYDGYERIIEHDIARFNIIDAELNKEEVVASVHSVLDPIVALCLMQ